MQYTYNPWYFFGDDFNFTKAENNFAYLDQALKKFDNLQYSLFSDYLKTTNDRKIDEYEGDFLVYDEGSGDRLDTWSGFYTTKSRLKRRIRSLGKLVR